MRDAGDVVIPDRWVQPHQQRFIRPLPVGKVTEYYFYNGSVSTSTDNSFEKNSVDGCACLCVL